jgi:hypothetical protein
VATDRYLAAGWNIKAGRPRTLVPKAFMTR